MPRYWLLKSEPNSYSIEDLKRDGSTEWDGVRNYQARNYMRDSMQIGDKILFYHSSVNPPAVVGVASVCSKPHPDTSAFDPEDSHFDPKSDPEKPVWFLVDIAFEKAFEHPVDLPTIKADPELQEMVVAKTGSRLSVQPVEERHFQRILTLGS